MTTEGSDKKGALGPDSFARVTSLGVDIHGLMSHFFNALSITADFDAGAYFVNYKSHIQVRLFRRAGLEMSRFEEFKKTLIGRVSSRYPGHTGDMFEIVEVSVLTCGSAAPSGGASKAGGYYKELPLFHKGEPSGMILLCSYAGNNPFAGSSIMTEMTLFINRALDGVFEHAFEEEMILADIISSLNHGVYLVDRDGILTVVNKKGSEFLSGLCVREMGCVTKRGGGLFAPGCACGLADFFRKARYGDVQGKDVHSEEVTDKSGRTFFLTVTNLALKSSKYSHVITAEDITEEKLLQNRLVSSSKLASLGEMVAGIAHEINNPLQAILLNIELFEGVFPGHNEGDRLARIKESVLRIKRVVRDLLIFAREKSTETENTDINVLIRKSVEMVTYQFRISNINVRLDLDEGPLIVRCNRNLFQQVLINLLQNAKDAMEESRKGSTIQIRSCLAPGKEAVVEISDDGPGIPKEVLDKLFDPSFTAKDIRNGAGLDLSVSRRILENVGGTITVSAFPPNGATFRISLPHHL